MAPWAWRTSAIPHVVVVDNPDWDDVNREEMAAKLAAQLGGANVEFVRDHRRGPRRDPRDRARRGVDPGLRHRLGRDGRGLSPARIDRH